MEPNECFKTQLQQAGIEGRYVMSQTNWAAISGHMGKVWSSSLPEMYSLSGFKRSHGGQLRWRKRQAGDLRGIMSA